MQLDFIANSNVLQFLMNILDIAIVTFVIYKILILIRGTRAVQLIKGILVLGIVALLSNILGLHTISWILAQMWAMIFIAVAIIFQPELRRTLEQLGRGSFFSKVSLNLNPASKKTVDEIVKAALNGSKTKTGMLICIEQQTGLNDYIANGIPIDAIVSEQVLVNIFVPNTPLHDGATIIRGGRIVSSACFLPLTDNPYVSLSLGTRHRAAIGLSEVSDAVIVVVSEETGGISVARNSKLVRSLDEKSLRQILTEAMVEKKEEETKSHIWKRWGDKE